jgi:hypothetical protein
VTRLFARDSRRSHSQKNLVLSFLLLALVQITGCGGSGNSNSNSGNSNTSYGTGTGQYEISTVAGGGPNNLPALSRARF